MGTKEEEGEAEESAKFFHPFQLVTFFTSVRLVKFRLRYLLTMTIEKSHFRVMTLFSEENELSV